MKNDLSQEIHGNMKFSVYMYKCFKYDITFLEKVTSIGEVTGRKRPPALRKLSFKFRH